MSEAGAVLEAGLDEDEARAGELLRDYEDTMVMSVEYVARRLLREVEAGRRILALWPDPFGNWTADQAVAARAVKDQVVRILASVYGDGPERTRMWRDLVEDRGIDRANRAWPALDPERGGPGYLRPDGEPRPGGEGGGQAGGGDRGVQARKHGSDL